MAVREFNEEWFVRPPVGPFAALDGDSSAEPRPVILPHDALRDAIRAADVADKGAGAYFPPGAFTYLKTFDVPAEWAQRVVVLEFGAAMRHAQVFVNEEFAGNRANGYARFFVDATPFLRPGAANEVRVEVRTGGDSRWYSGAGLHRGVRLHVLEPVHIVPDGVRVTVVRVEDDQAVVEVAVSLRNLGLTTASVSLASEISGPDGGRVEGETTPVTVPPGSTQLVRHRLYLSDPRLWSTDHPDLYRASVALDDAEPVTTTFGVRTITADPRRGLRINGEPVLLRGACVHHDNGPLGAAAVPRAEERRIELLKAAGFNAIRAAHNPLSGAMLDACDRHGMLVMDEAFDMWVRFKSRNDYAIDFPQWWREDLGSMVAKDFNHPSVILYSLGNEIVEVGRPHGSVLARSMAEHIRALDGTRLITNGINAAVAVIDELPAQLADRSSGVNELMAGDMGDVMNAMSTGENVTRRTAESSSVLDVLGLNYAEGRYAPDSERFPHRVIVGSETFGPRIGRLWPMVEANPNVIGDFTWTGWDYLGEVGIGSTAYAEDPEAVAALEREFPYLTADCADLDITGFRRPISYYREIVFGLRTEPYLAVRRPEHHGHTITQQSPWSWSDSVSSWTWPGYEGRPVTVEVYADAEEVALLLDGRDVARSAVGGERPRMAVLETTYQPGRLEAVAYLNGAEIGRTSLSTAGEPVQLAATADRAQLAASSGDVSFVTVELLDAVGRLFSGHDRSVRVEVTGAGTLAGLCSGNPKTIERFDSDTWRTFNGRLLAVVRASGVGAITVRATAEGLAPATVELAASS